MISLTRPSGSEGAAGLGAVGCKATSYIAAIRHAADSDWENLDQVIFQN